MLNITLVIIAICCRKMSIITSKSTVLSILRTPNRGSRSSLNRVRFQLPSDIKKIFVEYKKGFNNREYEDLVCTIRDSEISDNDLLVLLKEAKSCISVLSCDLRLFVQALIIIRWTHRDDNVIKCYQEFINDLVSAHSQHTKIVIDQLVKLFLVTEECDWNEGQPSELQQRQFLSIHQVLKSIMDTLPMSEKILFESVKHHYPYVKATGFKQQSYIYNMFRIMKYHPSFRLPMLQIIVDRLIAMDVLAPREEISLAEESGEGLVFEMDMEVDNEQPRDKCGQMKHPLGDILDISMKQVFQFIEGECFVNGKLALAQSKQLLAEMLSVFENIIIKTHATHHVQFLIFYLCSFDKTLAHDFLRYLWRSITNLNHPAVIRQAAAAYLSSFLARAEYLPIGVLRTYLTKMSGWIHFYMTNRDREPHSRVSSRHHGVFYAVCSALFYLISFRHKDLVDSKKKLVFLQSLNLSKMVLCRLNPLKFCLPEVVDTFAAVTRAFQLAYCYTVMENNARDRLPSVKGSVALPLNSHIDLYFPFDHYVLQRTSVYIQPLYRDYSPLVSDGNGEAAEDEVEADDDEEDDFIREQTVAPSPSRTLRDISYSTSPGFKHMSL